MKTLLLSFIVYYSISTVGISGKIVDKETSEELVGVMVIINERDTTYTDFDGNFYFNKEEKIEILFLRYPSYSSDSIKLVEKDVFLIKK